MTIPFRVKLLTETAKAPHRNCESDLWDLFADDFDFSNSKHNPNYGFMGELADFEMCGEYKLRKKDCVLIKTGVALELPTLHWDYVGDLGEEIEKNWCFCQSNGRVEAYAVADIRHCSNSLEQKGLFIENKIITGGEISFVAINHGHEPITISKGDIIAKMIVRSVYPSKMEIVEDLEDTGRGAYNSTGY